MRIAFIATLVLVAGAVHFANESPAGANAYLFFAVLLLSFGIYSRGMRHQNYWLSLTGLVEAWFIFDYCFYGTAVSVLQRSKTPLPASMDEAYSRTYLVGALAFLAFACGAYAGFARSGISRSARAAARAMIATLRARRQAFRRVRLQRAVFLFFTIAGVLSIVVLLLDPESRQQLFFDHVGLSPREGMGRYTDLFFMLPTTALGLWYLSKPKRRYSRILTMAGLFLIAALHLGCGRRLMWAGTMLLVFHLCKVRGIFTLRARYLVVAIPLVLLVSLWMEATKNIGWYSAADAIDITALADGDKVFDMVDNSVGRFDTTAALIVDRETQPYYYGETFLMAPLQILPVSAGFERSRGVREELGELIYGAFDQGLVSQEASLVGELYANFGYFGVMGGFLLVGFGAAFLDGRCHHSRHPIVALGYGLCLFRAVHQLATASTSWFPLTFLAFVPWLCAVAVAQVPWGTQR
ncbi:MAG TPA: hypothetical protein VMQ86_19545 [Bryobacteraceae bacterium]|jgi:hypothetical protein|nr:hypothetical protein [Bryobacteraceae bacterium]